MIIKNTPYIDKNHGTGDTQELIKIKKLNHAPVMIGAPTVQLFDADTMELQREVYSENLIKDSFHDMMYEYMRGFFTSLGYRNHDEDAWCDKWRCFPNRLVLLNDAVEPVETAASKTSEGDTLAYAYFWDTYTNAGDTVRGSVLPNLCHAFPDVANKRNVYRMVFEFPQHVGNGEFNKVGIKTWDSVYWPNPDLVHWSNGESYERYKSFSGHHGYDIDLRYACVYNGYMYILDRDAAMAGATDVKLTKSDLSKCQGDIVTGGVYSESEETICTVDFSNISHQVVHSSYGYITYGNFKVINDTTALYVHKPDATAVAQVKQIDLTTGAVSNFGAGAFDLCTGWDDNYNHYVMCDVNSDASKIAILYCGSGDGADEIETSYRIYDVVSGNTILNNDRVLKYSANHVAYNVDFLNDSHLYIRGNYYHKIVGLSADNTTVETTTDLRSGDNEVMRTSLPDGYWDRVLKKWYSKSKNVYSHLTTSRPNSDYLCVSGLLTPIQKNSSQIMRIQYDFIVPWEDFGVRMNVDGKANI